MSSENFFREKGQVTIEKCVQKVKDVFTRFAGKLDEYYNKLPLDKINEKLGGKIDVKTPMVKKGVTVVVIVLLCVFAYICFYDNDPVIPVSQLKYKEAVLKISKNTFAKY